MDTNHLGFRRPPAGSEEWGPGETHDVNYNFTLLDTVIAPYHLSADFSMPADYASGSAKWVTRYVGKSIGTQTFPGDSDPTVPIRYFETIQDALDDVTVGEYIPQPIYIYPGDYNEEPFIDDKSVMLIGLNDFGMGSYTYTGVSINANRKSTSSGRAAVTIRLQNRTGPAANAGIHPARWSKKILIKNIWFQSYGRHYTGGAAHDSTTPMFLHVDGQYPTYYGSQNYIVFDNCVFRGQTWGTPPSYSWFKYGFHARASALTMRIMNSNIGFFYYGGGDGGKPSAANPSGSLAFVQSPFYLSGDGTNIWGIARKNDGGASGVFGSTTGSYTLSGDCYDQGVKTYIYNTSIAFSEPAGSFGWDSGSPPYSGWPGTPEYTGTGWFYGGRGYNDNLDYVWSDTSSAFFTLANCSRLIVGNCKISPAHADPEDAYYDPSSGEQWTNMYSLYNSGKSSDIHAGASGNIGCSATGFVLDNNSTYLGSHVWFNIYSNMFGYSFVNLL